VSGYSPCLRSLERALAHWEGSEAALVFASGFAANLAAVGALASKEDAVFSDAGNHASLIDGCRLSRAATQVYRHRDIDHLVSLLQSAGPRARRRVIVSDSVFSMDGDVAPVAELLTLAQRFDALLVLDEAHATGVLGDNGRGLTDGLAIRAVDRERLVKVGTLSKALGAQGGFVCGSRRLIDFLINHARSYVFSTALAPPLAAAARAAIRIIQNEPHRRQRVLELAEQLRGDLRAMGFSIGASVCQIVPLLVGDSRRAVQLSRRLQRRGLLVPAIRPPSVPDGTARLRMSLTAGHTAEDVTRLISALRQTLPAAAR
jgi:8-amino-7-oxononanoate synthase